MKPGPQLIAGGLHRDARGEVLHVNAFDFAGVDRGYAVRPAETGTVRGWVGHRRETKWFFVLRGALMVGVVEPDVWPVPARVLPVRTFELRDTVPAVLRIPGGYFTASVALEPGSIFMVYSTGRIEQAGEDDFRLPPDHWPWPFPSAKAPTGPQL